MSNTTDRAPGAHTTATRPSPLELAVTRDFAAPAQSLYDAWTRPELMQRWWIPQSMAMRFLECEMDARTGGSYRFVFSHPDFPEPMAFFGRYLEAVPPARLVWTNEESEGGPVTTVTFDETDGRTRVTVTERFPSEAALEAALESGGTGVSEEQFQQLERMLAEARS